MKWWHVLRTEALSNLRDRRTILSAFLFGPLMGPALFAAVTTITLDQVSEEAESILSVPVVGQEHAQNLFDFLAQNGIEAEDARWTDRAGLQAAVSDGEIPMALLVPEGGDALMRAGKPMRLELIADHSDSSSRGKRRRLEQTLDAYGSLVAQQRLMLRGIPPLVVRPLVIDTIDVSTPGGRALALLGMLTYFVLFSALIGCMYLAIDGTAGERERGSLEPLLVLPVARRELALGKIGSAAAFSAISVALSLVGFTVAVAFIPLGELGMTANFGAAEAGVSLVVLLPFSAFAAALLNAVGVHTKSVKEAQSYMSVALLVPTLPILFASILGVKSNAALMLVPALSQHLLITQLLEGSGVAVLDLALSLGSTSALAAALAWLVLRRLGSERVLV